MEQGSTVLNSFQAQVAVPDPEAEKMVIRAQRTAFIARFIVLRESKRTRAHRIIETMEWEDLTTPDDLADRFRKVFKDNGDNMSPVERDLRRALAHSNRSLSFFVREYSARATSNFIDALFDYERSNTLLFGAEDQPKPGGWRLPSELLRQKQQGELDLKVTKKVGKRKG